MTLDELLTALFPAGHTVTRGPHGTLSGTGSVKAGIGVAILGIVDGTPVGIEAALLLAGHALGVVKGGGNTPIVVLVDTSSQRMSRRDELLGLNEYLAHLSKSLALAASSGHRTVGILYGHAAAGAFIATALSTQVLVAVPGAEPSVMDLPSISRVTKLPIETLQDLAKSTPIFAPGLDPMLAVGGVFALWTTETPLADQLASLLAGGPAGDQRDALGLERGGRARAAEIARTVAEEATAGA